MRVLVVGGGGREHALVWKLSQSPKIEKICCAPGNAGIAQLAECVNIPADEVGILVGYAKKERFDLTVVGPEIPLSGGIVDRFERAGLRVFGPSQRAAEIEGSKVYAKDLCKRHDIPTADFEIFDSYEAAREYVHSVPPPRVVKADGLAAGKGVFIAQTRGEAVQALDLMMKEQKFGGAGERVVIEECLVGEEASVLAFTDGKTIAPMPSSQDHKRAFDDDEGPNTGGMGAYSPAPVISEELDEIIRERIMLPWLSAMNREDRPYRGVIYFGVMMTEDGPKVLEFNVRFGDPETQPIFMRLKSDLLAPMEAVLDGRLDSVELEWDERPSVCVVLASGGYPGRYPKGLPISGLDAAGEMEDVMVFHAGTAEKGGKIVTNGGRVLGVTALGDDIRGAIDRAYQAVGKITFDGMHYRKDIGARALARGTA